MDKLIATRVASGLSAPVFVTAPPADSRRLFIVEKIGRIRILDLARGQLNPTPFLELSGLSAGNEQGLLGLAFHPSYQGNGFFYVNVTDSTGATNVRRFSVSAGNPDVADPGSARTVLVIPQPFANHNGGWIAFGPRDGFLYIAMGDGGSANDPGRRAQNLGELLGKLLRIDVDGDDFPDDATRNYAIPPSNPFVGQAGARPEIWAYGLRNPWRSSFDRATGDLFIADVGQNQREEVNVQLAASRGGDNFGWRLKEGMRVTGLDPIGQERLVDPVHEYDHADGRQAIIGGSVYRSPRIPALGGTYFFADYTGPIWSFRYECTRVSELTSREGELFPDDGPVEISSFGEDAAGDVYIVSLSPGEVYRIEARPAAAPPATAAAAARSLAARKRSRFRSLRWVGGAGRRPVARAAVAAPPPVRRPAVDAIVRAVREVGMPEVEGARTPVEEARFLLQAAAEVEHALLVQYLYAAYSLDPDADPSGWRDVIAQIAKEEMGHLLTVQNLLLAIGGVPHFDLEDPSPDPDQAEIYPFPLRLQPVTLASLAKYVTTESPLPEQLPADLRARAEAAFALSRSATGIGINHVGVLYARLYWLFQPGETPEGPWTLPPDVFPNRHLSAADFDAASLDRQGAPSEGWYGAEDGPYNGTIFVKTIGSASDALAAIAYIARQGEGWEPTDNDATHFERFLGLFEQFLARLEQGGPQPTLPVPVNPSTGDVPAPDPAVEYNRITNPAARLWSDLFDLRYRMLVLELWLLMSLPRTDDKRARLIGHALRQQMMTAIRQITRRLVTLPRTAEPGAPGAPVAGPPFRLGATALPSDPAGQRQMLRDCMQECAALYAQLESPDNKALLKRLRTADEELTAMLSGV